MKHINIEKRDILLLVDNQGINKLEKINFYTVKL